MRGARSHLLLLWIAGLCLVPRLALADAAQARTHFDRGRAFFEVNDFRNAIVEFKAAHVERPDPAFLYNIAECHRRLGEASEALAFYRRFLATAPAGDKTRAVVEQRVAELKTVAEDQKAGSADPTAGDGDALALGAPEPHGQPAGGVLVQTPAQPPAEPSPFYSRPWFLVT